MNAGDWEAKQAVRAAAARALQRAHPRLVPVSDKVDSLVAAAKNIRIELARAFPSIEFKVRSKRFSMGDDIRVSWADGPTSAQVDAIINRYRAGTFDGMTDSYDYEHSAWTDAFGDAKYIFSERHCSDQMVEAVMGRVCRRFGVACVPAVDDYRMGKLWKTIPPGPRWFDLSVEVNRALSKHTYHARASK